MKIVITLKKNSGSTTTRFKFVFFFFASRFEGISWNSNETYIAYVAEEPSPSKPTFNFSGYQKGCSTNKDCTNWKGQGDFKEDWGEAYAGKRQPALFVINIDRCGSLVPALKNLTK